MSQRDDRYAGDLPRNTAEFRAAPDLSASTAEFKAFAAGQETGTQQRPGTSWPEQPWAGEAPSGGSSRTTLIVVGAIVVLAVIVAILLFG